MKYSLSRDHFARYGNGFDLTVVKLMVVLKCIVGTTKNYHLQNSYEPQDINK